jgi:hypothetical protein
MFTTWSRLVFTTHERVMLTTGASMAGMTDRLDRALGLSFEGPPDLLSAVALAITGPAHDQRLRVMGEPI